LSSRFRANRADHPDLYATRIGARLSRGLRTVGNPRLQPGRQAAGRMFQPVAQSPIKALAPEDLGILGAEIPDIGVESILAPFMQQAGLCIARAWHERPLLPHGARFAGVD
jgi:hypothetical protein